MLKQSIKTDKTALYYQSSAPNPATESVWFICHGYGQRAESFIRDFNTLFSPDLLLAAPEALNRFYLERGGGPVGASWMTREERESEISDYLNYLTSIYNTLCESFNNIGKHIPEITALGFSQGAATVWRWAAMENSPVRNIIIWGAELPPENEWIDRLHTFQTVQITLVHGRNDSFFPISRQENQLLLLERLKTPFRRIQYDAGHEIEPKTLKILRDLIQPGAHQWRQAKSHDH